MSDPSTKKPSGVRVMVRPVTVQSPLISGRLARWSIAPAAGVVFEKFYGQCGERGEERM